MSEKPSVEQESVPTLRVCIEYNKPIESEVLGDILCAFSNEFILFRNRTFDGYRDEVLCVNEINRGCWIIDFIINNGGSEILRQFFEFLKETLEKGDYSDFLKIIAGYILFLRMSLKIMINSNNTITNNTTINIGDSKAKKILASNKSELKKQLNTLEDRLAKLEKQQLELKRDHKLFSNLFFHTQNKSNKISKKPKKSSNP